VCVFCLAHRTDPAWAERAVDELDRVLVDHAHCEMKAAASALSLAARSVWAPALVRPLSELAREELAHFERILDEIEARGLELGAPPVDDYAARLLQTAKSAKSAATGKERLVDRLLCGALIEARSCERFKLLAEALATRGMQREHELYRELMASEAGHYTLLRKLAIDIAGDEAAAQARLEELAAIEAEINATLGDGAAIHG
jgi:tRNA 2-(methylsulfanyl)-N6-isopentenyladenosine37 hydroxylase